MRKDPVAVFNEGTEKQHLLKTRQTLENDIVNNIREIVFPFIDRLDQTELDDQQREYLSLIRARLEAVVTPFYRRLTLAHAGLTPTEIQVAGFVREGRTTKEIAQLLNSSPGTVEFHRNNLRKKLGLVNSGINLRTRLLSID